MADFSGADLDRHITGAWGARSNMGGEEPSEDECCEACGEPFDAIGGPDRDNPELCQACAENLIEEEDEDA